MTKIKWRVLVFPGGTEVGLEIAKSLRHCKEVEIVSASNAGANHASFFFSQNHIVPDVRSDNWLQILNSIIETEKIDFLFPANSIVIDHLAAVRKEVGCPVVMATNDIIKLTRSKEDTLNLLDGNLPVPKRYSYINEIDNWPVHIKPNSGYGAQGTRTVYSKEELLTINNVFSDFIVQENLVGEEYTIDCVSGINGDLLFAGPRLRGRVRMGTTMHTHLLDKNVETQLVSYAQVIAQKIPLTGAWFFQIKSDKDGILKLLEVEARIAGTMCFNRVRGVNFPLLSLFIASGMSPAVHVNAVAPILDRALTNRYRLDIDYDEVYVDLDDTLIVHDKLNIDMLRFLYQCINKKKKIILLSKSLANDKVGYLKSWKIYELFDEIYWLKEEENKEDYIKVANAIFIDDSFSQRKRVAEKTGIPTFDSSMIEVLIDERI